MRPASPTVDRHQLDSTGDAPSMFAAPPSDTDAIAALAAIPPANPPSPSSSAAALFGVGENHASSMGLDIHVHAMFQPNFPVPDYLDEDMDMDMSDSDGGAPLTHAPSNQFAIPLPEGISQADVLAIDEHGNIITEDNYMEWFENNAANGDGDEGDDDDDDDEDDDDEDGDADAEQPPEEGGDGGGNHDPIDDPPVPLSNPNPAMLGSENLGLIDFARNWALQGEPLPLGLAEGRRIGIPDVRDVSEQARLQIHGTHYSDLRGDSFDLQGIDWAGMNITRKDARQRRRLTYKNYVNKPGSDTWTQLREDVILPSTDSFFRFRRLQIRRDVFYAGSRGINRMNPLTQKTELALDMGQYTGLGAMISSLDASHGLLLAGSFNGDYFLKSVDSSDKSSFSEGQITRNASGITNHIQIHASRRSSAPEAAVASNDNGFRILDLTTERFVMEKTHPFPMNCTAISPDRRLRVMVGDNKNVFITDADTGDILQSLSGHRDYGFACDWAYDGYTVATGCQDKSLKIWDARRWCNSNGDSIPVTTIRSEMAGVRGLRFSPQGSGRKILVAAEEADFINVIDAQTFMSKQTMDIFGEIGGVSFTNDGQDLNVLCADRHRGGLLQFERCGLGAEPFLEESFQRRPLQYGWCNEPDNMRRDCGPGESFRRRPTMMDTMAMF